MSEQKTWRQLRDERRESPAYRAAYERTKQAYEIGRKVRKLRGARGSARANWPSGWAPRSQ